MDGQIPSALKTSTNNCGKSLTWLSLVCCCSYALFELTFPNIGKTAEAGLLIVTLISAVFGLRDSKLFTPFVLLGVSLLVQTAGWGASFDATEYGFEPDKAPRIDLLSKWFLFLFFALWLPRIPFGVPLIWAASIVGFLLMPWTNGLGINEFQLAIDNRRIDLGTMNAQHAAMLAGIMLLGSLTLFIKGFTSRTYGKTLKGLAFCTSLTSTALLYATQTRGVWLGVAVASVSLVILYVWLSLKSKSISASPRLLIPIITLIVITTFLIAINSNLGNRIDKESNSVMLALHGKIEEMPLDSTGIRLRSWYFAGTFLAEKPWFGWGPDGSKLIMQESAALPTELKPEFGHLHNTYLDIIAQFGIFGLALYLSLLGWLIVKIIKAFQSNAISLSTFLFGVTFFIYWSIVNIFESYMLFSSGKYAFTIVCSGIISLAISPNSMPATRKLPFLKLRKS